LDNYPANNLCGIVIHSGIIPLPYPYSIDQIVDSMANRLSQTTSPYLLQHAHNPVDWYPWGAEALQKAKSEEKPIFLSIGYAACHWCHVMAHESFEDHQIAEYMNAHFVNIKVDREERPDLDSIYMSATVSMTGSGGWPMSVFLTPDLKPFYAGTYFPPEPRYNMPSFQQVLSSLADAWQNRRDEITTVSHRLTENLQAQARSNQSGHALRPLYLDEAVRNLLKSYDWGYGGWGSAPKFPQPMTIEFLLRRGLQGIHPQNKAPDPKKSETNKSEALKPALHALHAMARGGIYDVVGGGFARYSTDNLWRVPHFEKMLYDNAQLALAYLHAWQITGEPAFRHVLTDTLAFVERELTSPEGGFYSSLDADSEGEEGKYYVWSATELKSVLSEDYDFFQAAYGVTDQGNWEGKVVLQRAIDDAALAARFGLKPEQVPVKLDGCHSRLRATRETRVRPDTDDKILTAWNALMAQAFTEAARAIQSDDTTLGNHYLMLATRNIQFLLSALRPKGELRRSWRDNQTNRTVFLEDYAALIISLLELYQTDFDNRWFVTAAELADEMIDRFRDPDGGFFDTPADGESLPVRPKDLQDNATPCGNSLATDALLRLAALTDNPEYRHLADEALGLVTNAVLQYPTAFSRWLSAADFALASVKQVALVSDSKGESVDKLIRVVREKYRPNLVLASAPYPPPKGSPPLLDNRPPVNGQPTAYICQGFVCINPVILIEDLQKQL
jgi:uncharacterized protein YyaL (SSP411 family)